MTTNTSDRISAALDTAVAHLLRWQQPEGYWAGYLSSSALATATALSALALAKQAEDRALILGGTAWICRTQNADGGWGDSPDSPSNLSTTLLVVAALTLAGFEPAPPPASAEELPVWHSTAPAALFRAATYLVLEAGATPAEWVQAITHTYGDDRTFASPILMNCALAGLVPWQLVPGLPFELATVPARWYAALRLQVVSYALPALISVGLLIHRQHPTRNPLQRLLRTLVMPQVLGKLEGLQPAHGGFLEATPLTSFVAMSLIPCVGPEYIVAHRCLCFLRAAVRPDGSWPIDTDLSVWVTTGAVQALREAGRLDALDVEMTRAWLVARQQPVRHPYTNAAPGGWGWTHRPGGVPDADDTAGAILALSALGEEETLPAGIRWLLDLQNADGGWPTFCRGWGQLPFDKSSPDITAHALRALQGTGAGAMLSYQHGLEYLQRVQRDDGAWVPLWFGNQQAPAKANAVLGTARVLLALTGDSPMWARGQAYLLQAQNPDGGWGGDVGISSTVEETALAVSALAGQDVDAVPRGVDYLLDRIEDGAWTRPAPIGLYFASLWYNEVLYPVIWTVEALGRVKQARKTHIRI